MNDRYSRQRRLPFIGDEGQDRLRRSKVVLVGCGALGGHLAQHLVRAGVGSLRLCDRDFVELDNLQRQVLFEEDDAKRRLPKAAAAAARLARINSEVALDPRVTDVHASNVESLIADADLVLDGTDNFETRFLLNDACVKLGKPWVYAGCVGAYGMVFAVRPGIGACFRCLVRDLPPPGSTPTCDVAGVLGPAVGVVASLQAAEAVKILAGRAEALAAGVITVDVWANRQRIFEATRQEDCPACAKRRFEFLDAAPGGATSLCGRDAVQVRPATEAVVDLASLEGRLRAIGPVDRNEFLLRARVEDCDLTLFQDGRAIFKGTADPARARALYAKYVGA